MCEGGNTRGHVTQCEEHEVCGGRNIRGHVSPFRLHEMRCVKGFIHEVMSNFVCRAIVIEQALRRINLLLSVFTCN